MPKIKFSVPSGNTGTTFLKNSLKRGGVVKNDPEGTRGDLVADTEDLQAVAEGKIKIRKVGEEGKSKIKIFLEGLLSGENKG